MSKRPGGSSWVAKRTVQAAPEVNWGPNQHSRGASSKPMMAASGRPASVAAQAQAFETGLPALNPDLIVGASARWGIDRGPASFQSHDPRGEVLEVLEAKARLSSADIVRSYGGAGMDAKALARLDNDKRIFGALRAFNSQSASSARMSTQAPKKVNFFA